jgi:hypothetical protein
MALCSDGLYNAKVVPRFKIHIYQQLIVIYLIKDSSLCTKIARRTRLVH